MWGDAVPNLLIGLREGLEAGLIVSILIGTVVRGDRRDRLGQLWAGVACAAGLSLAFGAVLTFAATNLSTAGQETIGGVLSLAAVGFVTWMVFWMRRSARTLSADLRNRTEAALAVDGRVVFVIAFLAVAREGLETALFLWSTTRTTSESAGPLIGAVIGLAFAGLLCWALYRQALRINLARFFTWTGAALVVIAAGVVGYGVRELQGAGILPGINTNAFDLTTHIDPSAWYPRLVEGVFNITPTMTVLQVVGYVIYFVPVLSFFVLLNRRAHSPAPAPVRAPDAFESPTRTAPTRAPQMASNRVLVLGASGLVAVVATVAIITVIGPKQTGGTTPITISESACAPNWSPPTSGRHTFEIRNTSPKLVEIYLMDANRTTAHGEIEGLAPGTSRTLAVAIAPGSYVWRCVTPDGHDSFSASARANGAPIAGAVAYRPVTAAELDTAKHTYRRQVAGMLDTLSADSDRLLTTVRTSGASGKAKAFWLQAHLDYIRLGAAYGTFGDFDTKINGRPKGLPAGVSDPGFTGFLRLEYELWQNPVGANPAATAAQLDTDVHGLVAAFPAQNTDLRDLPLRAHEILENGLQFELTGINDHGGHTNLATLRADVDATRIVLRAISAPLTSRNPRILPHVTHSLDQLAATLDRFHSPDGSWASLTSLTTTQRQTINGQVGQLVEELAPIPDNLELPPSSTN